MVVALYGKLPAKRDFIAEGVPRAFLDTFEPWLQGVLAGSRLTLGSHWQRAYFEAPIWRFHLGPGHCGRALLGALMPSVDGVGRSFPLVAFAAAPPACSFPSPLIDPHQAWFDDLETFLLSTLDAPDFAGMLSTLAALEAPACEELPPAPEGVTVSGALAALSGEEAGSPFGGAARAEAHLATFFSSVWWTAGGVSFPAAALCGRTLPDVETFCGMLTGTLFTGSTIAAAPDAEATSGA